MERVGWTLDHDFAKEEQELKLNTQLTREVHALTRAMHDRILGDGAVEPHA